MRSVVLILLVVTPSAKANSPVEMSLPTPAESPAEANSLAAVCRVQNQLSGFTNVGSGTLIDVTSGGREGLVLTCWHLFREGRGRVVVQFTDGRRHRARVIALDERADLAALVIANPLAAPVQVSFSVGNHSQLRACGFGQKGDLRCVTGSNIGETLGEGQRSLLVSNAVRSGDSGGGVFDESGQLVAVIWGERDGVTYASYGTPLRNFLGRLLGHRQDIVLNCPKGLCPQPSPVSPERLEPVALQPTDPGTGQQSIVRDPRFDLLAAAIEELEAGKQDRGDYLTVQDLDALRSESNSRHESVLNRLRDLADSSKPSLGRAAGATAKGFLGLSGPTGWAVLAAGTAGGWLLGHFMKRRTGAGGRRSPFR